MIVVRAPNCSSPDHLERVVARMKKLGPPRIRVVWVSGCMDKDVYWAIEGSHRLQAALDLGMIPRFEILSGKFRTIQGYGTVSHNQRWTTPEDFVKDAGPIGPRFLYTKKDFASGGRP